MLEIIQNSDCSNDIYNAFGILGYLSAVLFGLWYRKKFAIPFIKAILITISVLSVLSALTSVYFWVESGFTKNGTISIIRALPYLQIIIWPLAAILKLKWGLVCDFFAPIVCVRFGIGLWGCLFAGCCAGYPCRWGIYNLRYDGPVFPIQIIEPLAILTLFFILLMLNKNQRYIGNGKTCSIMLMMYGTMRFMFEFARNNNKIWLGCSSISFHALFMVAVGGIVLYCISKAKCNPDRNKNINNKRGRKKA